MRVLAPRRRVVCGLASFSVLVLRMSMRQMTSCINKALNECSDRYQQGREKKHWMNRDAESYSESNQQRRRRWFDSVH